MPKDCDVKKGGKRLLPLGYTFASFFGAAMIAVAFAYFNYKFSEYRFVNFGEEIVLYNNKDIFVPTEDYYTVVVFSSNMSSTKDFLSKVESKYKILAIDLYQKRFENEGNIVYVTSGMNTLLMFIQKFNIYSVPTVFLIKKINKTQYKQDSIIEAF